MFVSLIRSIVLYLMLIATIRLLGKRQLGDMEPTEFVVTLLIADLASVPMQDPGIPLLAGIVPILTILILEITLSTLSFYFIPFRKLLCGMPIILMQNGKIIPNNLKRTRITPDELTEHLREKDITDLTTVKYAILETNGQISALLDSQCQPLTSKDMNIKTDDNDLPVTIISGGKLLDHNLKISGHNRKWVEQILEQYHTTQKNVFLLTVTKANQIYISLKNEDI